MPIGQTDSSKGVFHPNDPLASEFRPASATSPVIQRREAQDGLSSILTARWKVLQRWDALRSAEKKYAECCIAVKQEKQTLTKGIANIDRKLQHQSISEQRCQSKAGRLENSLQTLTSAIKPLSESKETVEKKLNLASLNLSATDQALQEKITERELSLRHKEEQKTQLESRAQQLTTAKAGLSLLSAVSKERLVQNLASPEKILAKKSWQVGERRRVEILKELFHKAINDGQVQIDFDFVFEGMHELMSPNPKALDASLESSSLTEFGAKLNSKKVSEIWFNKNANALNNLMKTSLAELHSEIIADQGQGRYFMGAIMSAMNIAFLMINRAKLQTLFTNLRLAAQRSVSSALTHYANHTLEHMASYPPRLQAAISREDELAALGQNLPKEASVANYKRFLIHWRQIMHDVLNGERGGDFYTHIKEYLKNMIETRNVLKDAIRNFKLDKGGAPKAPRVAVDLVLESHDSFNQLIKLAQYFDRINTYWKDSYLRTLINVAQLLSVALVLYCSYRWVSIFLSAMPTLEKLPEKSANDFLKSSLHELSKKFKNVNLSSIIRTLQAELTETDSSRLAALSGPEFSDRLIHWIDERAKRARLLAEEIQPTSDLSLKEEISNLGKLSAEHRAELEAEKTNLKGINKELKASFKKLAGIRQRLEKENQQSKIYSASKTALEAKKTAHLNRLKELENSVILRAAKKLVQEKNNEIDGLLSAQAL